MNPLTDLYDLWVWTPTPTGPLFLVLEISQEKADRFYSGRVFWQPIAGFHRSTEKIVESLHRTLSEFELVPRNLWVTDYTYTHFSRRTDCVKISPVFGASVEAPIEPFLTREHNRFKWLAEAEAAALLAFEPHKSGLQHVAREIAGTPKPDPIFRLWVADDGSGK